MSTEKVEVTDSSYLKPDIDETQHGMEAPPTAAQTDRPSWLPEKFNNAEELAKSYAELERKVSTPETQQPEAEVKTTEDLKVENTTGLNLEAYSQEYADKGELSDKTYGELEKNGLTRDIVDAYIAGQTAIADKQVQESYSLTGGEDNYNQMMTWATENLSESEINSFNKVIDSGDQAATNFAISGMYARFQSNAINEPNLLKGQAATGSDVFRSTAEVVAAMQDKRYENDEAYRKDVEAKLARSNVF